MRSALSRVCNYTMSLVRAWKFHNLNHRIISPLSIRYLCDTSTDKRLKIYTRQGDKGLTSTFSGQRLPKNNDIFEAVGTADELNSTIGLAREFCLDGKHQEIIEMLQEIQSKLFEVGAHVATPRDKATPTKLDRTEFGAHHSKVLEEWIDQLDKDLPPLTNFILPSGGKASATLHLARTVCRRAERRVVPLYRAEMVEQSVTTYLNRLSDFLFTAARFVAHKEGKEEVIFKPTNNSDKK